MNPRPLAPEANALSGLSYRPSKEKRFVHGPGGWIRTTEGPSATWFTARPLCPLGHPRFKAPQIIPPTSPPVNPLRATQKLDNFPARRCLQSLEVHDIVNDGETEAKIVFIKTPYLPEDKFEP